MEKSKDIVETGKPKKRKKWPIILIAVIALFVIIGVVGGQNGAKKGYQDATASQSVSDAVKTRIKSDDSKFKSYNQQIAKYSEKKDKDNTTKVLTDASAWCDKEADALLKISDSKGLDKNVQQACLDVKTGLYAAKSSCYDPMISAMEGKTTSLPDYQGKLEDATTMIDNAYNTIK